MLLLDGIPIRFPEWSSVAMHVMLVPHLLMVTIILLLLLLLLRTVWLDFEGTVKVYFAAGLLRKIMGGPTALALAVVTMVVKVTISAQSTLVHRRMYFLDRRLMQCRIAAMRMLVTAVMLLLLLLLFLPIRRRLVLVLVLVRGLGIVKATKELRKC